MDYSTDHMYTYQTTPAPDAAASAVVVGFVFLFLFVFAVAAYAISAFLLGRIFKKAGVPQWVAWVPIYNSWKLLELGNQQGFWAVLALLPFVNIVSAIFLYIAMFHIGKKLGKEDWFILVAIFLPIVWLIWLGFDDSKWPTDKKSVPAKSAAKKTTTTKKTSA